MDFQCTNANQHEWSFAEQHPTFQRYTCKQCGLAVEIPRPKKGLHHLQMAEAAVTQALSIQRRGKANSEVCLSNAIYELIEYLKDREQAEGKP